MADYCETAYAAGLFDGEGCVQLYMRPNDYSQEGKPNNSFRANLSLASVDPAPLLWIKERWGGSLRIYNGPWRKKSGHRACYNLQLTARDAERFARDILPYLIIKRDQVELWLEARGMTYDRGSLPGPRQPLPAEEVQRRRELVEQIAALKKKEYSLG